MDITHLKNRLQQKEVIIMDGATGTEIQRRGVPTTLPLWSAGALLSNPEVIQAIHEDYTAAGAEIIITNTFRTNTRTLKKANLQKRAKEINVLACTLARNARTSTKSKKTIYIAGSIAPVEDCYSPQLTPSDAELRKEHSEQAAYLAAGKVDFILVETMITIRETFAAVQAVEKTHTPLAVSFCVNKEGNLLGGESLADAVKAIAPYNPIFVGINCLSPIVVLPIIKKLKSYTDLPVSVYANGDGVPDDEEGWAFKGEDKGEEYLKHAKQWVKHGAQVIGGCCGTTPDYIKTLADNLPARIH